MPSTADIEGLLTRGWLILLDGVVAAGFVFAIGGARLAMLGGSSYFVLAGVALVASGVLIVGRRAPGCSAPSSR